jgi:hypothetical protein
VPDRILSMNEAVNLAHVIRLAQTGARVEWLDGLNQVQSGTVRSIGDEQGNFLRHSEDVRDSFVRITTAMGWEWFPPMQDVLTKVASGEMVAAS